MAAGLRMLGSGGVEKLLLLPADLHVETVGNSALRGARMLLLEPSTRRARERQIAAMTRHVDRAADGDFQYRFAEMMALSGHDLCG